MAAFAKLHKSAGSEVQTTNMSYRCHTKGRSHAVAPGLNPLEPIFLLEKINNEMEVDGTD
ncbi:hypothetical protein EYF80_030377 [Liparis tanakae]|uniref:Uncharacterized protein n=1 Tax=Liparis tanakae TaxID=230148 RepID=A0A4Z2H3B6_9TELE|nr:hypothetical protein EYF80_030377 [Liparis tanakae]